MIHRIYFVLLLLFFPFIANAQIGKELILNGSFEDYPAVTTPVYDDDDEDDEEEGLFMSPIHRSR